MSFEQDFKQRFNQFLADLQDESDRAKVIIVASHLDVLLEDMLKSALVPSAQSNDSMFEGPNALMHSFSNKIDFCYRLGLISEFAAKSLHLIRKIRNRFAHTISGCSFDEPAVKSQVTELYKLHRYDCKEESLKETFNESTKSRFLLSSILVMGIISEMYHHIASNSPRQAEWPYSWLLKKS